MSSAVPPSHPPVSPAPSEGGVASGPGRPRIGLLPRILLAIALGVAVGVVSPEWLARLAVTFTSLFSAFLGFIVPVLIVALVAPAIAELGRGAGRWLGLTAGIAYLSTVLGGFLSLAVAVALFPRILTPGSIGGVTDPSEATAAPFFEVEMGPPFGVMTALLLAFVLGIGMTLIPRGVMQRGFEELRTVIERVVSGLIVPLLPVYIFGIFLAMAAAGEVFTVIATFLGVILIVFALTVVLLLLQFLVAGAVSRRNPLRALRTMLPAYATALGTSSSAATIPVTLR